jgi:hypothetical protein
MTKPAPSAEPEWRLNLGGRTLFRRLWRFPCVEQNLCRTARSVESYVSAVSDDACLVRAGRPDRKRIGHRGSIEVDSLPAGEDVKKRIAVFPALRWKAQHVAQHLGLKPGI